LNLLEIGWPLVIIYVIAEAAASAAVGCLSTFIKRGWTINRARKTAMLICAMRLRRSSLRRK
jgi:ACS family hexuronate transporter-like MFS transporter